LKNLEGKDKLAATQQNKYIDMIGFFPLDRQRLLIRPVINEVTTLD